MPLTPHEQELIQDLYFYKLEEDGIEYMETDQMGFKDNPFWMSFVKPEYDLTYNEMAQELGYKNASDWKEKNEN